MKILFLCVANSARSQMAEGLAKKILGPKVEIKSAGSHPSGKVNPLAIQVMQEANLDISDHFSKSWNELPEEFLTNLDYVITLCAEESCPVFSSKAKKLHWPIKDPGSSLQEFRIARNKIEELLKNFSNGTV